jgi:hypothetical protein
MNVIRTSTGMSCVGLGDTLDTLVGRTLDARTSGGLPRLCGGAVGDTGLYGRGGLRAIFRTSVGDAPSPSPPSFGD